jgi:hypothetical protein
VDLSIYMNYCDGYCDIYDACDGYCDICDACDVYKLLVMTAI